MENEALAMFISITLIINCCVEHITLPRLDGVRHSAYSHNVSLQDPASLLAYPRRDAAVSALPQQQLSHLATRL